jgi:hypothetical protein
MSSETLTTSSSRRFGSIAAFTAAAMLSGILSAFCVASLSPLNPFVGAIFGAAISICLSFQQRTWSAWRIIALLTSSVMAYFAAIWSPTLMTNLLYSLGILGKDNYGDDFSPPMFALAGFVGALVIMLAVLLLYFQEKGWRVPAKASALALPGALLGLISSIASESIQKIVAQWVTPSNTWGAKPEQFYSAYLVWQTGMGLVMAALLPSPAMGQPAPARVSPMKLSVGGKIFAASMLAGSLVLGFLEGQDLYQTWQSQHHTEKSQGH